MEENKMVPEWEEKARKLKEAVELECPPEGTIESLAMVANCIKEYAIPEFPANEQGQIHFMRAVFESAVDQIEAFIRNQKKDEADGL